MFSGKLLCLSEPPEPHQGNENNNRTFLSLCVCVCVCVCAHAHMCARVCMQPTALNSLPGMQYSINVYHKNHDYSSRQVQFQHLELSKPLLEITLVLSMASADSTQPLSPCSDDLQWCTSLADSFFFFFLFLWLHWVFVAAHGLSLVVVSGGYSSLQCAGFSLWWLLLLQSTGSRHAGFSSCSTRAQQLWFAGSGAQAQQLWLTGLVALRHVGSSQTRDQTHVPCIGRQILNHCATSGGKSLYR